MDEAVYRNELLEAYTGEIIGAAAFGAMADSEALSEKQRGWLRKLATLEQVTRSRMEPLMTKYGLTVDHADAIAAQTRAAASGADDWEGVLASIRDGVLPYIPRFEALLAAAKGDDVEPMQRLLNHELALHEFATAALAGEAERGMAAVDEELI